MNSYTIYIRAGGLMEDPRFHWERHAIGEGNSPKEAAINALKNDELFNEQTMTVWGWQIGYETTDGSIMVIHP